MRRPRATRCWLTRGRGCRNATPSPAPTVNASCLSSQGRRPVIAVGGAAQCAKPICGPCAGKGACTPFLKKLEQYERGRRAGLD